MKHLERNPDKPLTLIKAFEQLHHTVKRHDLSDHAHKELKLFLSRVHEAAFNRGREHERYFPTPNCPTQ